MSGRGRRGGRRATSKQDEVDGGEKVTSRRRVATSVNVAELLTACQRSKITHRKHMSELQQGWSQSNAEQKLELASQLKDGLLHILAASDHKERGIDNAVDFIVQFATSSETSAALLPFLLTVLLTHTTDGRGFVRARACRTIGQLLRAAAEQAVDEQLIESLLRGLTDRSTDKYPPVREAAAAALSRLQEPGNAACPATQALLYTLRSDSSTAARKAALTAVVAAKHSTLLDIVSRTRDASLEIRVTAYGVLADKVLVQSLSKEQRKALVAEGLRDREQRVRDACLRMIEHNWLARGAADDLLAFVQLFDVLHHEPTVELVLFALFERGHRPSSSRLFVQPVGDIVAKLLEQRETSELRLDASLAAAERSFRNTSLSTSAVVDDDDDDDDDENDHDELRSKVDALTAPLALLWRLWIERAAACQDESLLDELVPSAPHMACLIDCVGDAFVTRQLFLIAHFVFLRTDTFGRNSLASAYTRFLDTLHDAGQTALIPLAMKRLHEIYPRAKDYVELAVGLMNDLYDTIGEMVADQAFEDELRQLTADVDDKRQQLAALRDPDQRRTVEQQIDELLDALDQQAVLRCAQDDLRTFIYERTCAVFESIVSYCQAAALLVPAMQTWLQRIADLTDACHAAAVKQLGLRSLCLVCLVRGDLAATYFPLICRYAFNEAPSSSSSQTRHDNDDDDDNDREDDDEATTRRQEAAATRLVAMRCYFDVLAQHGRPEFLEQVADVHSTALLEKRMARLIRDGDDQTRGLCAEGVAKLLFLNRLSSVKLLARLLMAFFDPATAKAYRLRQCLQVFFTAYGEHSADNRDALANAFLVAWKHHLASSAAWDNKLLAEFSKFAVGVASEPWSVWEQRVAGTTDHAGPHYRLAVKIVQLLRNNPDNPRRHCLARCLRLLRQINLADRTAVHALADKCRELMVTIGLDRNAVKAMDVFVSYLHISPEEQSLIVDNDQDIDNDEDDQS